jgi:ribosomal protein S18 acetylase RimI-like enzyme
LAAGAVIGCVSVEALDHEEWYLSMLAIDPRYQELGLGNAVMLEAEKHAQAHGGKAVRISVVNKRGDRLVRAARIRPER